MKYCKKCKHLHNDDEQVCSVCNKPLLEEIKDENTPVYLLTAVGFELQRVKSALEDNGVPCDTLTQTHTTSVEAVTGYDTSVSYIVVPYSAYEKAYDVCIGIGAIKDEEADIIDDSEYSENKVKSAEEEFEEMSGVKRTTVRVVSAILLLMIFAGVIWGVDFIANFIKGLLL